jgi:hypothetical protein
MKIHFIKSEYGTYGGGLVEPFRYLYRVVSDRFQAESIKFSFEEIEIQLALLLPKIKKEEYIKWYNKLPTYYRGKNMVRVILPVTERQKNLTDVFQLLYKSFDILALKKKKDDIFDTEKIKTTLSQLEKELQATDLWELNRKYELLLRQEFIEKVRQDRVIREQANDEKKRLIHDLRFYYKLPDVEKYGYFSPYDNEFCYKILENLRERKFRLPNYTHLYILVSDTFENALYRAVRGYNWHVYGIAVLENYADYAKKKEVEKQRIVFELIKQGLSDIAKIDKLDSKTLNEVLDEVEQSIF